MANDAIIIFTITVFLMLLGGSLPFVQEDIGQDNYTSIVTESVTTGMDTGVSDVNAWDVITSIFKMFFWTFGAVPLVVDLAFLTPLRVLLAFVVARNIWVGGGA